MVDAATTLANHSNVEAVATNWKVYAVEGISFILNHRHILEARGELGQSDNCARLGLQVRRELGLLRCVAP